MEKLCSAKTCLKIAGGGMHPPGSAPACTNNNDSYPARYDSSNRSFHHVMNIFSKLGKKMKFQTSKNFLNWRL